MPEVSPAFGGKSCYIFFILSYPVRKRALLLATKRVPYNATNQLPIDFGEPLPLGSLSFLFCVGW